MQSRILILCLSFLVNAIIAQQAVSSTKGASPLPTSNPNSNKQQPANTYAVVVGISNYQDPDIPDLRFADKDALAFSNYLRSRAGGSLDEDHLKVLVDSAATMAAFASALDWLKSVAKEGDRVIIYFSGHGDIETKTNDEMGFLLCYDASSRVYMAGGAFPLFALQNVVSALSTKNSAKVILIADACHSGTLAGSSIGGPHITAEYLKALDNEIKILSCQPNEFSIEGEQWGGGRGAFSYHLIDALYGMADENKDKWITLQEAGRYLEHHVSEDVAPIKQVPIISGERYERLAIVDTFLLEAIKQGKTNQMAMLAPIESRSEDIVLAGADTSIQRIYKLFKKSLKDKIFLESSNPTDSGYAELYYQQLIKVTKLEPLYAIMRRNYATALQDDAQQVMNAILKTDVNEITRSKVSKLKKYKNYPAYLNRAAELLGEDHFFYKKLKARQYFFDGLLLYFEKPAIKNPEEGTIIMQAFRNALKFESNSPHLYYYMMQCQVNKFENKDSAIYYANEAMKLAPLWVLPYTYLSFYYSFKFKNLDTAKIYLDLVMAIDSQQMMVISTNAAWYFNNKEYEHAKRMYLKLISKDSTTPVNWLNLGAVNLQLKNNDEAESAFFKTLALDSTEIIAHHYLGVLYARTLREVEAEKHFLKAIQLNKNFIRGRKELARLYRKQKRNEDAEKLYREIIIFDKENMEAYLELARLTALKNQVNESLEFLELAFKYGFKDFNLIQNEDEFLIIKNSETFKKLIIKYYK